MQVCVCVRPRGHISQRQILCCYQRNRSICAYHDRSIYNRYCMLIYPTHTSLFSALYCTDIVELILMLNFFYSMWQLWPLTYWNYATATLSYINFVCHYHMCHKHAIIFVLTGLHHNHKVYLRRRCIPPGFICHILQNNPMLAELHTTILLLQMQWRYKTFS